MLACALGLERLVGKGGRGGDWCGDSWDGGRGGDALSGYGSWWGRARLDVSVGGVQSEARWVANGFDSMNGYRGGAGSFAFEVRARGTRYAGRIASVGNDKA